MIITLLKFIFKKHTDKALNNQTFTKYTTFSNSIICITIPVENNLQTKLFSKLTTIHSCKTKNCSYICFVV
jgi:hypothetical protein